MFFPIWVIFKALKIITKLFHFHNNSKKFITVLFRVFRVKFFFNHIFTPYEYTKKKINTTYTIYQFDKKHYNIIKAARQFNSDMFTCFINFTTAFAKA